MTFQKILNDSLALLIDLEKRKIPFRQFQKLLTEYGLPNGTGWVPIQTKWKESFDIYKHDLENVQKQYNSLIEISEIFSKYNNKAVYIFKLNKDEIEQFETVLINLTSTTDLIKSQIINCAPLSLAEENIANIIKKNISEPILISQENTDNRLFITSVTFNNFQTKVELDNDEIKENVSKTFHQKFDTIIGYKSTYNQGSDQIVLDKRQKKLYLFIDFNLPQSIAKCDLIASEYIKLLQLHLPSYQFRYQRLSLTEKVRELYSDNSYESRVVELNHHTSTNSNKKEKMANKKDLRKEIFHEQGLASIDFDSELYYIKIIYEVGRENTFLELTIPGAIKNTNWDNRAVLGGCTTMENIDILLDKLIFTINE